MADVAASPAASFRAGSAHSFLIGVVGKPSVGKSSFLNAATRAKAKVGAHPFTTIEPNEAVGFARFPCPCARRRSPCAPRHGACHAGVRDVPVKLLDVAGLVPGASEGRGIGNTFLDTLRRAHVLIHVVDASGRTDAEGRAALQPYDPRADLLWLPEELALWVCGNLLPKLPSAARRSAGASAAAAAAEAPPALAAALHPLLSGYGARLGHVEAALRAMPPGPRLPADLAAWSREDALAFARAFCAVRFPTVIALNQVDRPEAAAHLPRVLESPGARGAAGGCVPVSALAELYLQRLAREGAARYDGSEVALLRPLAAGDAAAQRKFELVRDLILERFGSTGVRDAVDAAVALAGLRAVFPVAAWTQPRFEEVHLCWPGTRYGELFAHRGPSPQAVLVFLEGEDGRRVAENDEITADRNVVRAVWQRAARAGGGGVVS